MRVYRVYIVDDEGWIVIGLKKTIEKSGYPFKVIGTANNGVIALEEIEKADPDVIFMDIRMPGYDGLELLEHLRDQGNHAKVIYISGYAEFAYAQRALQIGASDYILKPIEQEKINEILEQLENSFKSESGAGYTRGEVEEEVSEGMLQKIITEIKTRYTENISLSELAERYGISISYLSSLVKEELHLSFSEYITAKRIQKAKELLEDETLSIEQIAEQTGYNDYFYFTKIFKKTLGISPSKYRKNYKKSNKI